MQSPRFIRYRERVIALEHVTYASFTPANPRESEATGETVLDPSKLRLGLSGSHVITVVGVEAEDLWKTFCSLSLNVTRQEEKGVKDASPSD